MRVTSDRQTLILAGETPPPRRGAIGTQSSAEDAESPVVGESSSRVTIISARVDAIVTQGIYTPRQNATIAADGGSSATGGSIATAGSVATSGSIETAGGGAQPATLDDSSSLPEVAPKLHQAYVISSRGAYSAASAYARTRDLTARVPSIIDTYA